MTAQTESKEGYRKCPYCAEEIKAEAIKCKHCGSNIDPKIPQRKRVRRKLGDIVFGPAKARVFFNKHKKGVITVHTLMVVISVLPFVGEFYYPDKDRMVDERNVTLAGIWTLFDYGATLENGDSAIWKATYDYCVALVDNEGDDVALSGAALNWHMSIVFPSRSRIGQWFDLYSYRFNSKLNKNLRSAIHAVGNLANSKSVLDDAAAVEVDKARANWRLGYRDAAFKRVGNATGIMYQNMIGMYQTVLNETQIATEIGDFLKENDIEPAALASHVDALFYASCEHRTRKVCYDLWTVPQADYFSLFSSVIPNPHPAMAQKTLLETGILPFLILLFLFEASFWAVVFVVQTTRNLFKKTTFDGRETTSQ